MTTTLLGSRLSTLLTTALFLSACATSGASVEVVSQARGSAYFSLSQPMAYKAQGAMVLAGRVCRRARTTLLSPPRVRIEHVSRTGEVVDVAHAYIPAIYRRSDQACANYSAKVEWRLADEETLRACFDRGGACPAGASVKAAAPAAP